MQSHKFVHEIIQQRLYKVNKISQKSHHTALIKTVVKFYCHSKEHMTGAPEVQSPLTLSNTNYLPVTS